MGFSERNIDSANFSVVRLSKFLFLQMAFKLLILTVEKDSGVLEMKIIGLFNLKF